MADAAAGTEHRFPVVYSRPDGQTRAGTGALSPPLRGGSGAASLAEPAPSVEARAPESATASPSTPSMPSAAVGAAASSFAVPSSVRRPARPTRWRVARRSVAPASPRWSLDELSGRMCELSGAGAAPKLTLAFALVHEAQRRHEPVAWVTCGASTFFPPDVAEGGVDLDCLPVVFAPDASAAARAAARLARSGAFGLIVIDIAAAAPAGSPRRAGVIATEVPVPLQSRLAGLAQRHDIAVVCLTEKADEAASLGALVSLRCTAERVPDSRGGYLCRAKALKDKRRGPGWSHAEVRRGPAGLC